MLHLKDYVNKSLATAPYQKSIRAYIVCAEDPKHYDNEKGEHRQVKICGIADEETAMKMAVYDPNKFANIAEGNTVIVRNFIPKEDTIVVTKNSKLLLTAGITVPPAAKNTAFRLVHPPPPPVTPLGEAKLSPMKKRVTVQGKVIQEQIKQQVNVKNSSNTVPIRIVTLKQGKETCKVSLWREKADLDLSTGDFVTVTDLVVNNYKNEVSLMSTSFTSVEKSEEEAKDITMTIIGFDINDINITFMTEEEDELIMEKQNFMRLKGISSDDELKEKLISLCNRETACVAKGNTVLTM